MTQPTRSGLGLMFKGLASEKRLAVAVTLILISGCESAPVINLGDTTVRDSAGIVIVENASPVWTDATHWRLADEPVLQVGAGLAGNPDHQFGSIVGLHRLGKGNFAAVDAWIPAIIFFDSTGTQLGRIDRRGTGPGEFPPRSAPRSFTCGSDTVYVVLPRNIAAYVAPGEYVRSVTPARPATVLACGAMGVLAEAFGTWRSSTGLFTDSTLLIRFALDGAVRAVVDTLPWQVSDWIMGPEGRGFARAPFSPTLVVAARDSQAVTGFGSRFQIDVRDTNGKTRKIIRLYGHDGTVLGEHVEQFASYVFSPWRGNEDERRRTEQRLNAAIGQPLPAFGAVQIDQLGNVWVRSYDNLDAVAFYDYSWHMRGARRPTVQKPRQWRVFNPKGHYLGIVEVPSNYTVHDIGSNSILGVWHDDLEIQYIRVYQLIKPGG